jgi:predicted phosphodiesterase
MKWLKSEIEKLKKLRAQGKTLKDIVQALGRSQDQIAHACRRYGIQFKECRSTKMPETKVAVEIEKAVKLKAPAFGALSVDVIDSGPWMEFGLVGDTHLCCKQERLAELHATYDLFAREGITHVLHAGNIVDGHIPKINGDSVFFSSVDGQCQYVIDNYPKREGIVTHFITGDDHEGWWQKEGFNFGAYLAYMAKDQGRNDLDYIGHVEADIELKNASGASTIIKVQHPGGGSAYARSYTGQKQVEALEGGEKPAILIQGHYHVSNYMNERNIAVISLPGFQDQTIFARKKRLRMEIGGGILGIKRNPKDGAIMRCRVEFIRYFTRGYYKAYLTSDKKIMKGHLVLK